VDAEPRDGLAYVRGQIGREPISAFARLLGLEVLEAAPGLAVVGARPSADHLNVGGTVHGGFLSALMDYATGVATMTTLPPGFRGVHAQATYSFLRVARGDEALICRATCIRASRTVAHLSAEVRDDDEAGIATAAAVAAIVPFH
jgi:uncharacterized protein (TIGR00369 family)